MAAQTRSGPNLWQRAIGSLPLSTIRSLDPARTGKRDVALAALRIAEEKRQLSLKKRWRIKNASNDGEIIIRDVLEKIIHWVRRFRDIGDQVVQYDPGHAALPWAAFRFLLQVAINETTVFSGMVEDLEMVARLMARFYELEKLYLWSPSAADDQLSDALVKVYAAILEFLAKAIKLFGESTAVRLLKAPYRSVDESGKEDILAKEAEVLKIATLVDAERLVNIETQVRRLADISIASQKAVQEQKYIDVLRWLSDVPYSRHHGSHRETRASGTGQWLFQHADFLAWASTSSCSLLLVHGIPGSGKTVLCSAIVDSFTKDMANTRNEAPLAYFYCNASESEPERRTSEGVMRSLTRQLTVFKSPQHTIHSAVLTLYERALDNAKADGFELMKADISDCVELILAALEDNPAILVVDAFDEIDDQKRLADALSVIISKSKNVIKVLITSRGDPTIFAMLPSSQTLRITDNQNKSDVRSFAVHAVTSAISDYKLLRGNVTVALKERLIDALVNGAGEMFLWIKLQLLHLCCFEHEKDLIAALTSLSTSTLDELYRAAYERIQEGGTFTKDIATRSFAWLLYAREPLTLNAFLSAIVAGTQLEQVTADNILAICRGFLYMDEPSRTFRFAHHSVREFVKQHETLEPSHAQSLLAASCLSSCNDPPDVEITNIKPTERFYDYTVLYCGHHFSAAQTYGDSSTLAQELRTFFLDGDEPSLSAKIWMDNVRVAYNSLPREHPQKLSMELVSTEQCSALFPICTFGLWEVLGSVAWPAGINWNERNAYDHTTLYAASFFGHTKVVAFLLDQKVDSNIECGRLGSALHCAAYRGHTEVVKLLLDYGTDVRLGDKFDDAIHAACRGNQEEVVLTIMEDAEIVDQVEHVSILEVVSEAGFSHAMEKLQSHAYRHTAKPSKTFQMVNKIIASGKVVNLKYVTRKSMLAEIVAPGSVALSALHGHDAMTTYLLDQGLDITEAGELGTPLRCASLNGHSSVCHLLLSRGANVDDNGRFGSALHAAAMKGQLHIVRLLLDARANVNIHGGFYGTPLQAAAYQGHKEVVSLLLGAGADPQQPGFSKDAFHAAAEGGHHSIIELLLLSGFELLQPLRLHKRMCFIDPLDRNLLREFSQKSQRRPQRKSYFQRDGRSKSKQESSTDEDEVEKEESSDPSNPTPHARAYEPVRSDQDQKTLETHYLLEAAAALGHLEMVRKILTQHKILNLDYKARYEALLAASRYGHRSVVEEIINLELNDKINIREALQEAASHSNVPVVRMLLAHGHAAKNQFDHMKVALTSSITGNQQAFHEILKIAERSLLEIDLKEILLDCLPVAGQADRADILHEILARSEAVDKKKLMDVLTDTCKYGKAEAAKFLYGTMALDDISRRRLSKCFRLAVENGRFDVVRNLFPFFGESGKAKYSQHFILVAAGCGYLDILELLLDNSKEDVSELLQQALIIGAENGHDQVCAYLLSKGLNPWEAGPSAYVSFEFVGWGTSYPFERDDIESASSDSGSETTDKQTTADEATKKDVVTTKADVILPEVSLVDFGIVGVEDAKVPTTDVRSHLLGPVYPIHNETGSQNGQKDAQSPADYLRPLNAVESCLSGFKRFEFRDKRSRHFWRREKAQNSVLRLESPALQYSRWRKGSETSQTSTLRLLLESVPSLNDPMWDEAVCAAAKLCQPSLVAFMLAKGANARARYSALSFAVGRECFCFPILRTLVENGAGLAIPKEELRRLLANAAAFFEEHLYFLSVETKSLEDVFDTGPGAVVNYILQRLPEESVTSEPYSVLLQCAAAAGQADLVTLLVEHQVNVNWTGSYYGTALQAASRFGHAAIVRTLISAGADPNLRKGSHCTALRAAVVGESLEAVILLLEAGANTELSKNQFLKREDSDPTPLQLAVNHQYIEIAQALIGFGADVNVKRETQQPLLVQACKTGDIPFIRTLLEAGADVQTQGHKGSHSWSTQQSDGSGMHAAIESGRVDVIELLLSKGFRLYGDFTDFDAPLIFAAYKGDLAIIDTLLKAEPLYSEEIIYASLKTAIQHSNFVAAERILYHRSSVLDNDKSVSILKTACNKGNIKFIELLLEELCLHGQVEPACTAVLNKPPTAEAAPLEMMLEYVLCSVDLFVEACARGHVAIVKTGIKQRIPPSVIDSKGRPALHFAAIHGSAAVVELLLKSGADPIAQDPTYGIPLGAALEGYTAKKLARSQLPGDLQAYAQLLIGEVSHPKLFQCYGKSFLRYERQHFECSRYQEAEQYRMILHLLLENGALPHTPQGPFGSFLTLSAFTGIQSIFNMLMKSDTQNTVGGYLHSPIVAAIEAGHLSLARAILKHTSDLDGNGAAREVALVRACQKADLPAVKLLLDYSADCQASDDEGNTLLHISLRKLAKSDSCRESCHEETIVNLLLDANITTNITDEEITAAAGIPDNDVRRTILMKMMPKAENCYYPESAFISLIRDSASDNRSKRRSFQKLLNERRIKRITTLMLCAARELDTFTRLLDYDPAYSITPATLDSVARGYQMFSRESVELLLQRDESLIPSESNIFAVLGSSMISRPEKRAEKRHLLEVMFSRNPQLRVTTEMLIAVKYPQDLEILLAHTTSEEGLINNAVIEEAAMDLKYRQELLDILLSFDHTIVISPEIADRLIKFNKVDGLARLWKHDPSIHISEKAILSLIGSLDGTRWMGRKDPHGDFVKLLSEHRAQWQSTRRLRDEINRKFSGQVNQDFRNLYQSVFGKLESE